VMSSGVVETRCMNSAYAFVGPVGHDGCGAV